ncbi:hypothetical protein [Niabella ginsenosidivorans]|nr:hypothetical protein [Niabella ginsenosidivorans]
MNIAGGTKNNAENDQLLLRVSNKVTIAMVLPIIALIVEIVRW